MVVLAEHVLDEKNCTSPLADPGLSGVSGTVAQTRNPEYVDEPSDDHAIRVPAITAMPFSPGPVPEKTRVPTVSVSMFNSVLKEITFSVVACSTLIVHRSLLP